SIRPSGSQPIPDGRPSTSHTSSIRPSGSRVITLRAPMSEKNSRPSCHRGPSTNPNPFATTVRSMARSSRVRPQLQRDTMTGDAIGRLHKAGADCREPAPVAGFGAAVLGLAVIYADDDWVTLGPPAGDGTRLGIQRAPDHRPPSWPDPARPQQIHLDVFVDDLAG